MMLVPFSSDWNHHVKLLATILRDYSMALPLAHSHDCQRNWLTYIGLHQDV